jgi:hypothetical protein
MARSRYRFSAATSRSAVVRARPRMPFPDMRSIENCIGSRCVRASRRMLGT